MRLRISLITCLLVIALLLPACAVDAAGSDSGLQKYEAEFINLFDTLTRIVGYAESKAVFEAEVSQIKADLEVYHQLYDIYHSYPGVVNLKDVNDHAGQGPIQVDEKIIALLQNAKAAYALTGGQVNIALGSVLKIWHDYREAGVNDPDSASLPPLADLQAANRHTRIEDLVIDEANQTVTLKDPEMRLDVGAVAKGYATEQVALAAISRGADHLLLSVGGNVRAIGYRNTADEYWRVGIEKPDATADDYLAIVKVKDLSVVTSGIYERYYVVDGKRYHHIIDPVTLFPENRYLSVTIITHDSGLADILSTALFNLSLEEGSKLIESIGQTEALWCLPDGTLKESSGFAAYR
jgi:FAD:protein FMN transferase